MRREIGFVIKELIVVFIILVTTYSYWDRLDNKMEKSNLIAQNNSLGINIVENNISKLYPMTDEYAIENIDDTIINISNTYKDNLNYKLGMKINKNNNLDYKHLKIKVNNEIYSLDSRYDGEDQDYVYFDLIKKEIDTNSDVNFAMWLDEDAYKKNNVYNFTYSFYVEKI